VFVIPIQFGHIKAVCFNCGWFRHIGRCGSDGQTRVISRLRKAKSTCNFIEVSFRVISAEIAPECIQVKYPGFIDPTVEWDYHSKYSPDNGKLARNECRNLIEELPCPRCKKAGHVTIQMLRPYMGGHLVTIIGLLPKYAFGFEEDGKACS